MILKLRRRITKPSSVIQYDILVPVEKIDCAVAEELSIWVRGTVFYLTENSYKQVVEAMETHYTGGY